MSDATIYDIRTALETCQDGDCSEGSWTTHPDVDTTGTGNTLEANLGGLIPKKLYRVEARARNGDAESPWSQYAFVYPTNDVLAACPRNTAGEWFGVE